MAKPLTATPVTLPGPRTGSVTSKVAQSNTSPRPSTIRNLSSRREKAQTSTAKEVTKTVSTDTQADKDTAKEAKKENNAKENPLSQADTSATARQAQRSGSPKTSSRSTSKSRSPGRQRSVGTSSSGDSKDLQLGVTVAVGDCSCRITEALGMGSFGTVWAADGVNIQAKLAVKEIACWTDGERHNALFEKHLLDTLGDVAPIEETKPQVGSQCSSKQLAGRGRMPALVGHSVFAIKQPGSDQMAHIVRLAMTRVPGVALEDFLEERRRKAASLLQPKVSAQENFAEACDLAHALLSQLAPVFQSISEVSIHRDVNTHNILIDTSSGSSGAAHFGLVDFGLAVDRLCWCSNEDDSVTKERRTRVGVNSVYTWRYLDIAGDCRYWPVSAWTQFLIGWKEIDADKCLRSEYQVQLDQHALGITAMKVFMEILSPSEPRHTGDVTSRRKEEHGIDYQRSAPERTSIPHISSQMWILLRAWESYWKRISPVHKNLINTFHNGGDWEVLKTQCQNTNFYDNIQLDLKRLRQAAQAVATACHAAASGRTENGCDEKPSAKDARLFAKAANFFEATLLLISDGKTEDMLYGPEAWKQVGKVLAKGSNANLNSADSHEFPTASACSSTASTEAPVDQLIGGRSASSDHKGRAEMPPHQRVTYV
jgi:hypothetical protein